MVFLKDITVSKKAYLVILDDEKQPTEKGTCLRAHKSLIGPHADEWPKFVNPLHKTGWCRSLDQPKVPIVLQSAHHHLMGDVTMLPTLGRRIIDEKMKWGDDVDFVGEVHYIRGYWEWTEDILSRYGDDFRKIGIFDSVYASLFTYDRNTEVIKAFCEAWCPSTNTLLTSSGELSISLWDLHVLSGLPMNGMLYDEMVPCADELIGADGEGRLHVPMSCKYLFHAYHILRSDKDVNLSSSVSVEDWIRFWSRKAIVYQRPPSRKEKKAVRSKLTYNPSGDLKDHGSWTYLERMSFAKLGVKEKHWYETHLAAYLVCWLCTFVLPKDDADLIRPSTFKMASIMASRKKVALTIPVLASIYRGLNLISRLPELSRVQVVFPIHFVYGWLACYFKTHFHIDRDRYVPKMIQYSGEGGARYYDPVEARRRIYRWDQISWNCTILTKDRSVSYVDSENVSESEQFYFMAIRSNYLAWRLDDNFVLEPYSPHRFSRQFGYYQVPPGVLSRDIREANLEDGVQYWRACLLRKSFTKAIFPSSPLNAKKFTSVEYKKWWNQVHGNFLEEHITVLAHPKANDIPEGRGSDKDISFHDGKRKATPIPVSDSISSSVERHWKKKKPTDPLGSAKDCVEDDRGQGNAYVNEVVKEVFGTDDETSSQDSYVLLEPTQPNEFPQHDEQVSLVPTQQCGAVSEFNVKSMIDDELKSCLRKIWGKLRDKIMKTKVESLSALEDEIRSGVLRIKSLHDLDISHLEDSINLLFSKAVAFDKARSASREIGESSAQELREVKASLDDARTKEKETIDHIASLKEELAALMKQKEELTSSLKQDRASFQTIRGDIKEFKGKIDKLKDAPIDGEALGNLKTLESLLKSAQKALEDQDPFA